MKEGKKRKNKSCVCKWKCKPAKCPELQNIFEMKMGEYDFIGPKMDFKMRWTDSLREHWTIYVYGNTLRGKLLQLINIQILPVLRKSKLLRKLKSRNH